MDTGRFEIASKRDGLKKRVLSFDADGRLYFGAEPVLLGAAIEFYAECRQRGKVSIGLPSVFEASRLEREITQAEGKLSGEIERLEEVVIGEQAKEAKARELVVELRAKIERLRAELDGLEKERGPAMGIATGGRSRETRGRIEQLKADREEASAPLREELEQLQNRATIPAEDLRMLLCRLDEREAKNDG